MESKLVWWRAWARELGKEFMAGSGYEKRLHDELKLITRGVTRMNKLMTYVLKKDLYENDY